MTTVSAVETDQRRGESVGPEVVAVGFPLSAEQRQTMAEAMGPGYELEDIRQAPADAALVLVPPCSPQALRALQALFPIPTSWSSTPMACPIGIPPDGRSAQGPATT